MKAGHGSGGHASAQRAEGVRGGSAASRTGTATPQTHGQPDSHRPRGGVPIGTAVPRPAPATPPPVIGAFLPSRPLPYVGFTAGSVLRFTPFMTPNGYGGCAYAGSGYGVCGHGGFEYGYSGYGSPFAPYPFDSFDDSGQLRLQVEPKNAEVLVDGYYAGVVDDFDGHFQHLDLTSGAHHVEIIAPGYQPLTFDTTVEAHHKATYRGALVSSTP